MTEKKKPSSKKAAAKTSSKKKAAAKTSSKKAAAKTSSKKKAAAKTSAKKKAAAKKPSAKKVTVKAASNPGSEPSKDATRPPEAILEGYVARRKEFLEARKKVDEVLEPILRRYVAALFREHQGLNAVALSAYQDYDSSQLVGRAYVKNHFLEDDAWTRCGFFGPCPKNDVSDDTAEAIADGLWLFWRSLERKRRMGWCIALWRDPSAPDGVKSEERDHPGFD